MCSIYVTFISQAAVPVNAQVIGKAMEQKLKDVPSGLTFRLSNGTETSETGETVERGKADPLSRSDANGLLKRLPAIKSDPSDEADFAKRAGTLPAPKNGNKLPVKFPSDEMRNPPSNANSANELQVLRYSPEGEVKLAPDLNVTFSQPMVAVSSQEIAAKTVPVEFSPAVEGNWRWLGTKTLMFDTTKRFPMATKFTARVPAGTKAATGQVLKKDVTWTFTTPPPKVEEMVPNGGVTKRDALMYMAFDQAINAEAMLRSITVTAGGKRLPVRLATQEEIDADYTIAYRAKAAQQGRWIAFRAVSDNGGTDNALPAAATITITVNKGAPSAEGPLTTTVPQNFYFQTYKPLTMKGAYCGYQGMKPCPPSYAWQIEFNNPIDTAKFKPEMIKISPAVGGLNIYPSGNNVYINGYKKGRTSYTVTIDPSISDIFGQSLGKEAAAVIKVDSAPIQLGAQGGAMTVLDPSAKSAFSIYTTNLDSVKVRMYKVLPADWAQFVDYLRHINYDDGQRPSIPGRLVSDETVRIKNVADDLVEARLDVSKALDDGFGNLIIDVEPTVKQDKYDRSRVFSWLQSTQIGLDAFVDSTDLVGFVTELRTGKPMSDVVLSIYPNGETGAGTPVAANDSGIFDGMWKWFSSWGSAETDNSMLETDGSAGTLETVETAAAQPTGTNGTLRIPLPATRSDRSPNLLVAKKGKDVAFLPENSDYYWQQGGSWYKKPESDSLRWFTFDDRKMYKPNEEVAIKGYIRKITAGKLGDVEGLGGASLTYNWSAKDPRGNEIAKGAVTTNTFGAFDLKFTIPDNTNLGYARVDFLAEGSATVVYSHDYQIQEFRRPEFVVSTNVQSEGPFIVGGEANIGVEAKYYAGGGLANAATNWTVTATQTSYTPPNRSDYTFGTWTPWWSFYGGYRGGSNSNTQTLTAKTDASGKHLLKVNFDSVNPARPYTISASAAVQDVNRQTWSSGTTMLVHPSSLYVGLKTPRTFVQKGEKIAVETIVTQIDGTIVTGRDTEVKAVLKDWVFDSGKWAEKVIDEQSCTVRSAENGQKCEFVAKQGGQYTISATVMDDRERFNESQMTVWVPGGKQPPKRSVEQEQVQIIPSKKDYAPGDTAELLVISPFATSEGVLTLRRDGIVKTERFTMKDTSITLKVPINEKYLPNIYAQVDVVGISPRTDDKGEIDTKLPPRPAYASGNLNLPVSLDSRKLTVTAEAADKTAVPGSDSTVNVEVKDSHGEPVADSEVALVVVDESVLALSRYSIADPINAFYTARSTGTTDYHSRKDVLLGNPIDGVVVDTGDSKMQTNISNMSVDNLPKGVGFSSVLKAAPSPSMRKESLKGGFSVNGASADENTFSIDGQDVADGRSGALEIITKSGTDDQPVTVRQNFNALALFSPTVKTDGNGKATVKFKLPDNLTQYRITAVSVDQGKRFGKGESSITAKQPLMVRPSAPRFMNFGDRIELPVVIQNQTDKDMAVDVAIRATNAMLGNDAGTDTAAAVDGKKIVVKANDRTEVRFPVSTVKAGTARFQIAATSDKYNDAAEISLPVWTPATTEAFATYGTTDQNGVIVQPVQTPGDVFPQFGGLELTTSSTQLQELTDAYIYLANYPYECSEQISSRMISTAALRDVLTAFKSKDMPSPEVLQAKFAKDVVILRSRQRNDGSFGLWKRDNERYEYPFLTIHVAHALGLAKAKGYKIPDDMVAKTLPYLKNIESHLNTEYYRPSPEVRWTISAYALYVRNLLGDKDTAKAKKLLAEATVEKMPYEALGWLLSVLAGDQGSANEVQSILHFLNNHVTETAAAANFVTDYGDGAWLIMYSNRRADGVLLEALIKADPKNDLIPKLVRGLLDHRVKGAWSNTQENVFILLALDKYFEAFEKVTPDFVTKVWLGNTYAGEQTFKGRSIDSDQLNIPMSYLTAQGGISDLMIDKQGSGRLYYRIGMKYAPKDLKLDPADYGFTVLRTYDAVDDKDDVKRNTDGSWTIKAGARVRVRLTMVAQARRYHVALVDQLPAGLEILNPELATTEVIPPDTQSSIGVMTVGSRSYGRDYYWWRANWFEHQNFRDERAEAFTSLLWEGVYNYTYVTRATTPGQFIVPPAKAGEMYHPETFGRTGTDIVKVE